MNLLPRVAEKSRKRQRSAGRFFLLGTAVALFVVLGPGVGSSISMQQDSGPRQAVTTVKQVRVATREKDQIDIRSRRIKERAEQRRLANLLREGKIKINPVMRKKIAFLLLLTGGQARNIRL